MTTYRDMMFLGQDSGRSKVRQGLRLSSRHYVVLNRSTIKSGHEHENWNGETDRDLTSRSWGRLNSCRNLHHFPLTPHHMGRLFSMPVYSVSCMPSRY